MLFCAVCAQAEQLGPLGCVLADLDGQGVIGYSLCETCYALFSAVIQRPEGRESFADAMAAAESLLFRYHRPPDVEAIARALEAD